LADEAHDRRVRALRGLRAPRLRGLLAAALVWTLLAVAPAWSSEVVQVRVGNHPNFTRVVFEFDAPTGYRVERRAEGEAENAIVVTFDAASPARKIVSRSPGVESVSVEAASDRAVARIVTHQPGLPIKEMILTDPPRVVLDLMIAAGEPAVAASEPVRQQPRPASPVVEPAPKPESPPVEREPSAPAETVFEPERIVEPAVAVLEEVAAVEETARVPDVERSPEAEPAGGVQRSPEAGAARRRVAEARARLGDAAESQGAPFDTTTVGVIAGGVLALLLVVFAVMRRRRSIADDTEVTALAAEGEAPDDASDDGRIPVGGFGMEASAGGEEHPAEDFEIGGSDLPVDEEKPIESIATGPVAVPGLSDEAPEEKRAMTMDNQDLPISQMDSEAATQLAVGANDFGVGGDSDIARMVQEFERRIAHLETRLNESIDARERLERQVAAQSEELRVQRAAIARTQRALRSMNRSEEDQATEPALREPSKPAGPQ
jgi:hypothetical protein